tara:strand:- start:555 stop:809 length:255 start_codon:yes stop_codon:yes gene_type:complete
MTTWLLAVAAAVVALWPMNKQSKDKSLFDFTDKKKTKSSSYLEAVAALQTVRGRLVHTNHLEEEQEEACNTLTLALSAGSDLDE